MRGDPALGEDPGGPGGQCTADGAGQGGGGLSGDCQVVRRAATGNDGTAGVQQDVRAAQGVGDPPPSGSNCVVGAAQDGRDVELDVGGGAAGAAAAEPPAPCARGAGRAPAGPR